MFPLRTGLAFALLLLATAGPRGRDALQADEPNLPLRTLPRDNVMVFHDAQGMVKPVQTAADWKERKREILIAVSAIMGTLPGTEKRCPLDVKVAEELDGGSYICRKITYQSEPGGTVPARLLIPKAALMAGAEPVPAVLCLHPTNAHGPEELAGLTGRTHMSYARTLAERGYVVIAPNYPILGPYHPDIKQLGWNSGTLKAVWDNIRGLDLLDSLPYVRHGSYAAIGHSLGGHNSVYTALHDERIKAVVSSCGLDYYVDYYGGKPEVWQHGKGWAQDRYMPRLAKYQGRTQEIPFDFAEMIAVLAPRKVLIVAPLHDANFQYDSVDRLVTAALPIYTLLGSPQNLSVLHPDAPHNFPPESQEAAFKLIDSVLKNP